MELPIDHFRLLGVSPTTDGQTVLRMLQQRLDRAPDQGFTRETIQARAELLRDSADLLSDDQRRQIYERELTSIAAEGSLAGLEIRPSLEVGGLLLLMEAGQAQEAFEAARRALQPPQAPSLGSGREADLTLLAGLACRAAAAEYQRQRRYETAARSLQQGLQQLQRMGQLPELRQTLDQELRQLQPYRVLDLIRRDLSAVSDRQKGIELLDDLVTRRGGLDADSDPDLGLADFEAFLGQIRLFLTAQEQVDLFSRWAEAGSARADILTSVALTAAGFVQRKPERIQAALQRLQSGGHGGMEPVMAWQQLLLGRVDQARLLAAGGTALPLQAADGGDGLASLCAACRRWLTDEVLPGFRDIDAEADLEAWFADRDVQSYIEQQDRIRHRQLGAVAVADSPGSGRVGPPSSALQDGPTWSVSDALLGGDDPMPHDEPELFDPMEAPWADWDLGERFRQTLHNWRERLPALPGRGRRMMSGLVAAAALTGVGLVWLSLRPRSQPPQQPPAARPRPPAPATAPATASVQPLPAPRLPRSTLPPTSAEPTNVELQALLAAWLQAKASLLAGRQPAVALSDLARPLLIERLQRQEADNRNRNVSETIEADVESLAIRERGPRRIRAAVLLRYSDERRDASGALLSRTPPRELRNVYVFARDGNAWKVADFRPGG